MKRGSLAVLALLLLANRAWPAQRRAVTGLVLKVDQAHKALVVSCNGVPGYMDAMVMTFSFRKPQALDGISPGAMVELTLPGDANSAYADDVRIVGFESLEQEPQEAQRLKLLRNLTSPATQQSALGKGMLVPDFTFTDQNHRPITFSQFAGDVVVLTFVYARCPNPNYCFRLNSNLDRLQRRFPNRMGRGLMLLSIVMDPEHDQGSALENYANIWKANPQGWHFLTGNLADVQRVAQLFGLDFWNGEGTLTHTFHTVVIDQHGRLAANLEGNQFTARQLGDLVETMLSQSN